MSRCVGRRSRWALMPALSGIVFATVGWGAAGAAELPEPEELPANTIARVAEVPGGTGVVTRREFHRALAQAAAFDGRRRPPGPKGRGYDRLKHKTVGGLLERVWLRGQAAQMGVRVTRRQVGRRRARLIRESFDGAAEFRRFLRLAHFTPREFFEEVEVELISERIVLRVLRGVRSRAAAKRAVDEFIETFEQRWRERTVCAPKYVVARCSNGVYSRESGAGKAVQ